MVKIQAVSMWALIFSFLYTTAIKPIQQLLDFFPLANNIIVTTEVGLLIQTSHSALSIGIYYCTHFTDAKYET